MATMKVTKRCYLPSGFVRRVPTNDWSLVSTLAGRSFRNSFSAFVFFYPAFNGSWIARFLYGGLWLIKPRQLCVILLGWLLSASVIGIYVYKNLI